MKKFRAESLDALRGFAIFMMVLSGSTLSWVLPNWMSHAQVPPGVGFDPSIYGITWVDLVFPFFLFAMGAAFPFAISSRIERGENRLTLIGEALWRYIKLAFFAIFLNHIYPWSISPDGQTPATWTLTLIGFVTLFALFLRMPGKVPAAVRISIHIIGIIVALMIMTGVDTRGESLFDFSRINLFSSNIIILVLANMAAFGTIIYILTIGRPLTRIAILPFFMAIILCKHADGSWQQQVFNWSPLPWLYRFDFLKYLFLVIPGTLAGEYLKAWIRDMSMMADTRRPSANYATALVLVLSIGIIAANVCMLYARMLVINLAVTAALVAAIAILVRRMPSCSDILIRITNLGAYLLMLGLFMEAFDGGIRKDPSSFDYYFTTGGLACYCLAAFIILCDIYSLRRLMAPLTMSGKNPMIAYVATYVFIVPLLNLCHVGDSITVTPFEVTPFLGFLRGFIITSLAIMVAMFFTRIKWFWRT